MLAGITRKESRRVTEYWYSLHKDIYVTIKSVYGIKSKLTLECPVRSLARHWLISLLNLNSTVCGDIWMYNHPTFSKTKLLSSYCGLMPLPLTVLVLYFFLTVSAGRPNISTSTYVPTLFSLRNWPEMTCHDGERSKFKVNTHFIITFIH